MASAAARELPLTITKPQRTKTNNIRRIVQINLELSPDRQQFANLFSGRVLVAMRLARHFFKMIFSCNQSLSGSGETLVK